MTNYKTKKIALNEIFEVDKKLVEPKTSQFDLLPFIGLENITSNTREYTEEEGYNPPASNCFYFNEKHILYGKLRPYLNKVYLPEKEGKCSMEILPLLPKNGYSREFIAALMQSGLVMDMAVKFSTGGRMPRANMDKITKMIVDLPVDADICNEIGLQTKVKMVSQKQMREASSKQEEAASSLQNSILSEVFPYKEGDKLPDGWKWDRLSQLSRNIQYGVSLASTKTVTNRKLLRITDIQKGQVDWDNVPYCDCSQEDAVKYELEDGDIVFARTGATTGKSFLVKNPQNSVFASYLIRVQCNGSIIPDFLYLFFNSALYWNYIGKGSRGGTLAGFNATMLGKIQVPYPTSKVTQEEIVKKISGRVTDVIKALSNIQTQSEVIEALPSAILRQTFAFN